MNTELLDTARRVACAFAIEGDLCDLSPHHRGHIHDTFVSTWRRDGVEHRYLHQRLNESVFHDIDGLMHNIEHVTNHLAGCPGDHLETLRLVPARRGGAFLRDGGVPWRTYDFVDGTESFDLCDGPERAYEAAHAFGDFQARLSGLAPELLVDTIPEFFSSPVRMRQFEAALAADTAGRADASRTEIEFALQRRDLVDVIESRLVSGAFPRRIVHGDTKLNNVLFDRSSGRALCIVDLDTCMPAYSLYDFGDLVRFTAATSTEDERDLSRVGVDLDLYGALVDGYRSTADAFLTDLEVELMPVAARLVTLTIGLRFLADHLSGDTYFKVDRDGHNLDRARVQFRMVEEMERQSDAMRVR